MSFLSRRSNLNTLRKYRPGKGLTPKLRRKMLLESLEPRAMLAADTGADPNWFKNVNTYIPGSEYQVATYSYLTAPDARDKLTIAFDYFKSNAETFGVDPADFDYYNITSNYVSEKNDLTHIYLQQTYNGLPVEGAVAGITLNSSGQVVAAASSFVDLDHPAFPTPITVGFEANDALNVFSTISGYTAEGNVKTIEVNSDVRHRPTRLVVGDAQTIEIAAQLHYVPTAAGGVELAWRLSYIETFDGGHVYDVSVSVDDFGRYNQLIRAADWVDNLSYTVYPFPAENPAETAQITIPDVSDPVASPYGWHDLDGLPGADTTNTTGNNVFAQDDIDGNDTGGTRPTSPTLDFNFPAVLTGAPATYRDAAIVNLFYATNVIHDVFYHYGFDEAAGNFQEVNYTGLGLGGDAVRADAQDGSGTDNANFATYPDGDNRSRMQMFLWANNTRDSSFDNGVIAHEYAHGITNRLTGGPADVMALDALQSMAMGEGWGDFIALWMTQKPGDTAETPRPLSYWVLGNPPSGPGIPRAPFSTDMSINPRVLSDFNGGFPNNEEHLAGEIWTSVLWDLNWMLINKYGYSSDLYHGTGGNNYAMQLVIDALKLQPANPTFLQARDAIIAADFVNSGGANYEDIWAVFARRGFGYGASAGFNADSEQVVASYTVPPPLPRVTGYVYNDLNLNGNREVGEFGIGGIVVYVDANNNGLLDANEISTTSGDDGSYTLIATPAATTVIVRQSIDPLLYQQTEPSNNGGYTVNVSGGGVFSGYDFGNKPQPGEIIGRKWNDLNGNGLQDPGEPGVAGVYIYVDYNNNGKIGILEPAGVTDENGYFRIINVTPGIWNVREVAAPGSTATFPPGDPANGLPAGAHYGVVVRSSEVTSLIDFGNVAAIDWGDAPDSYGTMASSNGASHAILPGFGLGPAGVVVTHDVDGQPSIGADADMYDDGVRPLTAFTPGQVARIAVRATTGGRAAGYLQGWIDFNHNGVFDANEKIISDYRLAGSAIETQIEFVVPEWAEVGPTYARFRYGYETGSAVSPVGPASVGEVEDYLFDFRPEDPIAVVDGPFVVKQDTDGATNPANQFDVLANDVGSTADNGAPPSFGGFLTTTGEVPAGAPAATENGTVVFNPTTGLVEYTPNPGFIGNDYFIYFVVDSFGARSNELRVDVIVAPTDPFPLDDTVIVPVNSLFPTTPGPHSNRFYVLANDFPPTNIFIASIANIDGSPVNPAEIRISADRQTIEYQPAANFQGTRQFIYTISDSDPLTNDRSAILTVQVSPPTPDPSVYSAHLWLEIENELGQVNGPISVGETFVVRGYARDLRDVGAALAGVEAAYMDVLFDDTKVRLLRADELPAGQQAIEVNENAYPLDQSGSNNRPGVINEVGGTNNPNLTGGPHGSGEVLIFTLRFKAIAAGDIQFVADPADPGPLGDRTAIAVTDIDPSDGEDNPDILSDTEVFHSPTPVITIGTVGGEGEYSNPENRLDVNGDRYVTALDALIIINELNRNGPRDLTRLWSPAAGPLPSAYIDVNLDGHITALDALNIINWLNSNPPQSTPAGGEGEAASTYFSVVTTSDAGGNAGSSATDGNLVVDPPVAPPVADNLPEGEGESSDSSLLFVPVSSAAKTSASTVSSSSDDPIVPLYGNLNSAVIDLLFAEEEEEVITGGNGSDDDSQSSDDLFGLL